MGCILNKYLCCDESEKNAIKPNDRDRIKIIKPLNNMYTYTNPVTMESEEFNINKLSEVKINTSNIILKRNGSISDFYNNISLIGEGAYGAVYHVTNKITGEARALKVIRHQNLNNNMTITDVDNEIKILKNLDHPNIMKIYEHYSDNNFIYIVGEFYSEGSLCDKLEQLNILNEFFVKLIMYEVLSAVSYMHGKNVMHGDLKLENIMIERLSMHFPSFRTFVLTDFESSISQNDYSYENLSKNFFGNYAIKIIDFGCSKLFNKKRHFKDVIGTLHYNAPEVLTNYYNEKSDLWSCGVIMYILLSGKLPFYGIDEDDLQERILKGEYSLEIPEFNKISKVAKDCIKKLLTFHYNKRPSAQDILAHPFFKDNLHYNKLVTNDSDWQLVLGNLKKYSATSKIQQAVLTYLTHNFAKKENTLKLRNIFKQIDANNDGKLSKEELMLSYTQCGFLLSLEHIDELIEKIDNDNNGFIEYEEFIRATIDKSTLLTETNLKEAFQIFDQDGNGSICIDEIKTLVGKKLPRNIAEELLTEANEGKEITYDDFKKLMESIIIQDSNCK